MIWFKHPLSDVQSENIGNDTRVWQYAVILKGATIGNNCNINCHTFIENDVVIGDGVTLKSGVFIWDGIRIDNNVFIGPNATFVNNSYPRSQQYPDKHIGAHICKGVSIGANATIMGDITIGESAMIGAGSMVTKDVPPFTLWFGNPAKQKGFVTAEGIILNHEMIDTKTGNEYYFENNQLLKKV